MSITDLSINGNLCCYYTVSPSYPYNNIYHSNFANTSVTNLTLTAQTEYIRKSAFIHCTDLRSVTSLAETPPSLREEAFSDETFLTATLYVPAGALETYQNASTWKNFYDIRELDLTGITSAAGADETIVSAGNGSISVSGATGWVEVYTTSGNLVGRQRVTTGGNVTMSLPQRGTYIVKAGGRAFKLNVE